MHQDETYYDGQPDSDNDAHAHTYVDALGGEDRPPGAGDMASAFVLYQTHMGSFKHASHDRPSPLPGKGYSAKLGEPTRGVDNDDDDYWSALMPLLRASCLGTARVTS